MDRLRLIRSPFLNLGPCGRLLLDNWDKGRALFVLIAGGVGCHLPGQNFKVVLLSIETEGQAHELDDLGRLFQCWKFRRGAFGNELFIVARALIEAQRTQRPVLLTRLWPPVHVGRVLGFSHVIGCLWLSQFYFFIAQHGIIVLEDFQDSSPKLEALASATDFAPAVPSQQFGPSKQSAGA